MGRPRIYASNAERQRAYRERHHVCRAESILPKRLEDALWTYADHDDDLYLTLVRALTAADPRIQAALKRFAKRRVVNDDE